MALSPIIAPVKCSILPLVNNERLAPFIGQIGAQLTTLSAKQAEYSKSGNYLTRSLGALTDVGQNTSISRINAKLEAFPAWNAASIEKRHGLLITLAQEVWKTTAIDV